MADAWKSAEEQVKAAGGDGLFVKLENDGDKVVGCFLGNPEVRLLHYTKAGGYEPFTAAHEAAGERSTPRTTANFYVPAEKRIKIIEMNKTTFKDVMGVREKYGFEGWFFEVKRNGAKGDKNTVYRVLPDTQIGAEDRAEIAKLKLHDLKKMYEDDAGSAATDMNSYKGANGTTTNGAAAAAAAPPGEPTIDTDTTAALVNRLKLLPREKVNQFLAEFKIEKVKELLNKSLPAALAMVDKLEGKPEAPPPAPAEVDPFA